MDQRIARLLELIKAALGIGQQLKEGQDSFARQIDQARNPDEIKKLAKAFLDNQTRFLEAQRGNLEEAQKIVDEFSREPPPPPPAPGAVRPDDIAKQFRTMIENIQDQARTQREGESAATIKNLDIELKGFIVIEKDEARIAPPSPDKPIDPGQLSTIRMSFGSIPVLRPSPEQVPDKPK